MLPTGDRGYLYKLRKEECHQLLLKLGLDTEGSVAILRVKLLAIAKNATPEQIEIFQEGKKRYIEARENTFIKTWVYTIPEEECKEMLENFNLDTGESDEDNRTILEHHLNNRVASEEKEHWVDYAKEFCKELEKNDKPLPITSTMRPPPPPSDNGTQYQDADDFENLNDARVEAGRRASGFPYETNYSRVQRSEVASLMDQVRKWGISFNGKGDPQDALQFLDRVKPRAASYQVPEEKLHLVLPVLLRDDAESWYQCNKTEWVDWETCERSFKLFFLPAKMREEMSDEVRSYVQTRGQPIKDFILKLKARMRFVPSMKAHEQLERIYKNLAVDYQLNIKRSEFQTLPELIRLGEDYEEKLLKQGQRLGNCSGYKSQEDKNNSHRGNFSGKNNVQRNFTIESEAAGSSQDKSENIKYTEQRKSNPFRDNPGTPTLNIPAPTENTKNSHKPTYVCFNCDKPGHTSRYCRAPYRPYCRICKKKGVRTEMCGCKEEEKPLDICASCRESGHITQNCPKTCSNHSSSSAMAHQLGTAEICSDRRPKRSIEIAGKTFSAILDTGATTSYLNANVKQHLCNKQIEVIPVRVTTRLANGLDTNTDQIYHVDVKLGEKVICQNLLVLAGMKEDVILGIDALEKLGFRLTEEEMKENPVCILKKNENNQLALTDLTDCELHGNEILKPISRKEDLRNLFSGRECCGTLTTESDWSKDQNRKLTKLLEEELKKFDNISGCTQLTEHKIRMKTDTPIRLRYFPKNPKMREIIYAQVDELLQKKLIEPSSSSYCSPIVLVKKKDSTWRMCVDYRKINENSERDAYPIPHIPNTLSRLQKAKIVSALDLKSGYWNISVHPESRQYTAFIVPGRGLFQWRVMPFGLHSAPATFQRFLDLLITQNFEDFAVAYLDDIIVFSESFEEHLVHLKTVLSKLAEANLQINKVKSVFGQKTLKYLGHIVGNGGIQTDPEKVQAIENLAPPVDVSGVRRIIGMAGWYGAFIPNFTEVIAPLNELLTKNAKFHWGERQKEALAEVKKRMKEAPILACPDYSKPFYLQTDASNVGLGSVLFQREGNQEKVIAFRSRSLSPHEKNYTTTEKECLAVVWAIQRNLEYLEGIPFTVITDHIALKWIFKLPNPTGRLGRWSMELRNHDFTVEYRKGKQNVVPDTLSRHPAPLDEEVEELCAISSTEELDCQWLNKQKALVETHPQRYPDYSIQNGQLLKNCGTGELDESNWKLCVAKPLRKRVLEENHTVVTAGHLGIRKTIIRIEKKYYWPGLKRDVIKFVNLCEVCLAHKTPQSKPPGLMHTTQAQGPWDIVTVDFIGPLPRSIQGHQYILVIQDKFSKWIECVPLRKATAVTLTKAVRERIFCRFGWPRIVISDNGSQFVGHIFKKFLKVNGIWHQLTPPYSPQCNSTERANRVVKTMVKMTIKKDQRKWDEFLPEIQFAVNTAIQDSSGFSPAELNFGRQLRSSNTLFDEILPLHMKQVSTAPEVKERIKDICTIAKRQLELSSQRQAKYYNLRRRQWYPSVGETVYKRNFTQSKAESSFNAKLAPNFCGPFIVTNYLSPTVVELMEPRNTKKKVRVHLKDLKQVNALENTNN